MARCLYIVVFIMAFLMLETTMHAATGTSKPAEGQVKGYSVGVVQDVSYLGDERKEKLDIYYPVGAPAAERFPGIVLIHGGGWMNGDKAAKREKSIASSLVPLGYVCISINYKLGEKCWPQNLKDCQSAVAFLQKQCGKYQVDPDSIGLIGGSAGGHLALMLGLTANEPNYAAWTPASLGAIKAVVDLYGVSNLLTRQEVDAKGKPTGVLKDGTSPKAMGAERIESLSLWKEASPVNHLDPADPPILILHGMSDTTVDYQQSVELADACKAAGTRCRLFLIGGVGHTFDFTPNGYDLRPIVVSFLDENLKGRK